MNWMDDFISRCLAEVPPGKYRTRAEKELRDHMETQRQCFTEAEILQAMGDPAKLCREYKAAWERSLQARLEQTARWGTVVVGGCLIMGCLYILTALMLGWIGFTMDAESLEPHTLTGRNFPILGGGLAPWIFYGTLFLVPYTLGALWLRFCFRKERRPAVGITLGLFAAWAGEKGIYILLSALIYGMPLGPELLARMARGGDTTAPWFDINMVLTFFGCLLLGQLFGQKVERRRELA